MKYVEPEMEIVEVRQNIFMLSSTDGGTGNGNTVDGDGDDWTQQ